jgi:hypothetical protein
MKLIHLVLALIILISVLLGIVAFSPMPIDISSAHPSIEDMKVGGDGAERIAHIGAVAYWLQNVVLLLALLLISLGVKAQNRTRSYWLCLLFIAVVMFGVWHAVYFGHQEFLVTGETRYFLGFPAATAWMIYGVWGSAALLTLLYVIGFRKFIYTHEDELQYEQLLQELEDEKLKQNLNDLTVKKPIHLSSNSPSTKKAN